jgi:hypothetical protein
LSLLPNLLVSIMKFTLFFELQTMVMKYKHSNCVFLLQRDVGLPARFPPPNELL